VAHGRGSYLRDGDLTPGWSTTRRSATA